MHYKEIIKQLRFCLVTDCANTDIEEYCDFLQQCILGGVTCVQLRAKTLNHTQLYALARKLKDFLTIPLIINDHIKLAIDIDAAGVHIGQQDGDPNKARQILGPNKYIGLSVESIQDVENANLLNSIDYIAASAVFSTKNKTNCTMYWGLDGLKKVSELSKHPVVAIGGINENNVADVIAHGAQGIAVIGALHESRNPKLTASMLKKEF